MDFVYIASPWGQAAYAKECLRNSLLRGETAAAMALLFDGALDLTRETERADGLQAALMAVRACHRLAVYIDRGVTEEMRRVIAEAHDCGCPVTFRESKEPAEQFDLSREDALLESRARRLTAITGGKS